MKQTALNWFLDQLPERVQIALINTSREAVKKALEMEKEQIVDSHIEGQRVFDNHPHTQWANDQAEQYYNETYDSTNHPRDTQPI